MDQAAFLKMVRSARVTYSRLSTILEQAWPERSYSKSTIGRWAKGERAIPTRLSPTLAFELGRLAGQNDQISDRLLGRIIEDQDKILITRDAYSSLLALSDQALDQMQAQLKDQ